MLGWKAMAAQNAPAVPQRPLTMGQESVQEPEQKSVKGRKSILATLLTSTKRKTKGSVRPKRFTKRQRDQARRMATKDDEGSVSVDEKHALAEHLRSIAPFNKRWQFTGIERKLKVTQASLQLLKGELLH
uniref:Protein kinase domain-containing protein n=1 Tax=Parascaris univalens TaxID=6257 RepID=A0A915CEH7_PARUN